MWRNLLQVLAHELNHLKQQHCDRHLNCVALACRCNLLLFSDVGPLETIAENKKEQKSAAKRDVQDFLPDFLTGFLLLNRSGLDAHERANILAAIRGEFWVKTVEKALREQWRDDDLSKRDRIKQYANIVLDEGEEPEDEVLTANLEAPDPSQDPHGFEAFMCDQHEMYSKDLYVL